MSSRTDTDEDLAFARLLLDAGRAEPLPSARTAAAFVTFAAGVGDLRDQELGSVAKGGTATVGTGGWAAPKWLALGAIVGGATTFMWLQHAAPAREPSPSPVAKLPPAATAPVVPVPAVEAAIPPASMPQAAAHAAEGELAKANSSLPLRRLARARPDLAAEVTALDGIRTALAIGAWRDAELQLTRYRREFAHGALRNEAEVLSITSLVAQGRQQAAASAAKAFLAAHPRDPQAARVRALME